MRVDTCLTNDGVTYCSHTWGTGRFRLSTMQWQHDLPIKIKTLANTGHIFFGERGFHNFVEKYGRDTYTQYLFSPAEKGFTMELTTSEPLKHLSLQPGAGVAGIKDVALANTKAKVKPNATLQWKATTGPLYIDGTVKLYCYLWE